MEGNPGAGDAGNGQQAAQHVPEVPRPGQPGGVSPIHQQVASQNGQNFTANNANLQNRNFVPKSAPNAQQQQVIVDRDQASQQVIQDTSNCAVSEDKTINTAQLQDVATKYADSKAKRNTKKTSNHRNKQQLCNTPELSKLNFTNSFAPIPLGKIYMKNRKLSQNVVVSNDTVASKDGNVTTQERKNN